MKTIEVKLFQLSELDDKAKEKARAWYRSAIHGDTFWSECVIDEAAEQAGHMGITIEKSKRGHHIFWSGFWSQGDGACFEGTWRASECNHDNVAEGWGEGPATTEIKRIAAEFGRIAKEYPGSSFSVKHRGHYSHENCTEFDFDLHGYDDVEPDSNIEATDTVEDAFKKNAKDFMRWIYRQLEKEYGYQLSEEVVDEFIEANEYEFLEDGTRSRF